MTSLGKRYEASRFEVAQQREELTRLRAENEAADGILQALIDEYEKDDQCDRGKIGGLIEAGGRYLERKETGDAERIDEIARLRRENVSLKDDVWSAGGVNASLRAENAKLREALESMLNTPDTYPGIDGPLPLLTPAIVRAARAALKGETPND